MYTCVNVWNVWHVHYSHAEFNSNEEDLTRISSLPLAQQMLIANSKCVCVCVCVCVYLDWNRCYLDIRITIYYPDSNLKSFG